LDTRVVLTVGQALPTGQIYTEGLEDIRNRAQLDTSDNGDLLFAVWPYGTFLYSQATGTLQTIAQHGAPGPIAGLNWATPRALALSPTGVAVFSNDLTTFTSTVPVLMRGQQIAAAKFLPLAFPQGQFFDQIPTLQAVRIADNNQLLWLTSFVDGGGVTRRGLVRDSSVVVLEGSTKIDGFTIASVSETVAKPPRRSRCCAVINGSIPQRPGR